MKFLKWLLWLMVLLGVVFVAGGFLLPSSTHVERSTTIDRAPAEVYAMLNSYQRFNEWSPWFERDPKAEYKYEGPASGVGAKMSWVSEQRDVGSGQQTIIDSVPDQKVVTELDFGQQGKARAVFSLTPEANGTRVVWGFDTDHGNNLVSRWFGLMFDRWIGADYEKGLAKLKTVMEGEPR